MRSTSSPASAPTRLSCSTAAAPSSGPDNTSTPDYMTLDDMHAVLDQVPGIVASSPMLEFHDNVSVGGGVTQGNDAARRLSAVSGSYAISLLSSGRFFDDQDDAGPRQGRRHRQTVRGQNSMAAQTPLSAESSASKAFRSASSASSRKPSTPTDNRRSATIPC